MTSKIIKNMDDEDSRAFWASFPDGVQDSTSLPDIGAPWWEAEEVVLYWEDDDA